MVRFLAALGGALASATVLYGAFGLFVWVAVSVNPTKDWLEGFGYSTFALMPSIATTALVLFWYRPPVATTWRIYGVVTALLVATLALLFVSHWIVLLGAVFWPVATVLTLREVCRAV
jgi:hypothetical protein